MQLSIQIQTELKTRSSTQIRSHAQKYLIKLCKEYSIKHKNKNDIKQNKNFKIQTQINNARHRDKSEIEKKILKMFNYTNFEEDFPSADDISQKSVNIQIDSIDQTNAKIVNINTNNNDHLAIKNIFKVFRDDEQKSHHDLEHNFFQNLLTMCLNNDNFIQTIIASDNLSNCKNYFFNWFSENEGGVNGHSIIKEFASFHDHMEQLLSSWKVIDSYIKSQNLTELKNNTDFIDLNNFGELNL